MDVAPAGLGDRAAFESDPNRSRWAAPVIVKELVALTTLPLIDPLPVHWKTLSLVTTPGPFRLPLDNTMVPLFAKAASGLKVPLLGPMLLIEIFPALARGGLGFEAADNLQLASILQVDLEEPN